MSDVNWNWEVATSALRDTVLKLNQRIEGLEAKQQWQPIETAPKDGSTVLLFVQGDIVQAHWGEPDGDYNNLCWIPEYGQAAIWKAAVTHWMPLPEPPKAIKGDE